MTSVARHFSHDAAVELFLMVCSSEARSIKRQVESVSNLSVRIASAVVSDVDSTCERLKVSKTAFVELALRLALDQVDPAKSRAFVRVVVAAEDSEAGRGSAST